MTTDILYIVSRLKSGGPTNQLYYIIKNLQDQYNPIILTLSPEPDDTELPRFRELGVKYETLGLSRFNGLIYGSKEIQEVVNKYNPDIVQTQGIRADTLSALFLSKYPRVTTIRNYPYDDYPSKFGSIQGKLMASEHLWVYRRIEHPVACSKTIADMVAPHGIDAVPIQNGVDMDKYEPVDSDKKHELRDEFNIPPSSTVFISTGKLIPRKNPLDVIKGFQRADIEDSLLLMLGNGDLERKCKKMANGDDRIRFEGWVDDVKSYLQLSDYFISASSSEGLPNTVMESLAVGLPVCLSDILPHEEILQYHSDAGTLFELNNIHSLSENIQRISGGSYLRRSAAAEYIVRKKLNSRIMSKKYQRLYDDIST